MWLSSGAMQLLENDSNNVDLLPITLCSFPTAMLPLNHSSATILLHIFPTTSSICYSHLYIQFKYSSWCVLTTFDCLSSLTDSIQSAINNCYSFPLYQLFTFPAHAPSISSNLFSVFFNHPNSFFHSQQTLSVLLEVPGSFLSSSMYSIKIHMVSKLLSNWSHFCSWTASPSTSNSSLFTDDIVILQLISCRCLLHFRVDDF